MRKLLCVLVSLVVLASAGSFAVSAEPFAIPGLEWSGLELTIYPAPFAMHQTEDAYDGVDILNYWVFVSPGVGFVFDVIGEPSDLGFDELWAAAYGWFDPLGLGYWRRGDDWVWVGGEFVSGVGRPEVHPPFSGVLGEWQMIGDVMLPTLPNERFSVWTDEILISIQFFEFSHAPGISVNLNGTPIEFDVSPLIVNNRTMVPFRAIFEALGMEVEWEQHSQTAIGASATHRIELPVGAHMVSVNGNNRWLDVPSLIYSDRTFVPVRFIAEATGADVEWCGDTQTVIIMIG